jgi:hypothetical protein
LTVSQRIKSKHWKEKGINKMRIPSSFIPLILLRFWCVEGFVPNNINSRVQRVNNILNTAITPESAYGEKGEDFVWESMRNDAMLEASSEPLLASFMHASILSHSSLERAIAFHIANLITSPAMISTQIQALILEFIDECPHFKTSLRMDILAVMDRDPAVRTSPDVILYFKG